MPNEDYVMLCYVRGGVGKRRKNGMGSKKSKKKKISVVMNTSF